MNKFGKAFEKVKLQDYAKLKAGIGKDSLDLAVKKLSNIKNVEIEYLNQSKKNGVAITLFEHLLDQIKTGACEKLADDLISILRFWIDAVRKKVTRELDHWWDFLKRILKFIQDIRYTDSRCLPDKLLQLSPSLLDLICGDSLSPQQCLNVLLCINMYSSVSGRQARLDNMASTADYFPKLARQILASGHYYYQFSALECIVRWIVPREPATLRDAAAYFPRLTNTQHTIFVEAKWGNFLENARNFLNAINKESGLVKSVMCKKIFVGDSDIYDSTNKQPWLDISTREGSVSAVLVPRTLQRLVGLAADECEALVFTPTAVTLSSGAEEVIISLKTAQPPRILPYGSTVGTGCDVTVLVSSRENLQTLHDALQNIFGDKYQRLIADDLKILGPLYSPAPSPCLSRNSRYSSDSARFSRANSVTNIFQRCGEVILHKNSSRQSSVSSTSLAQLSTKLAHLPKSVYKKEFIRLEDRVKNTLPHISETTEDSIHPLRDHRKAVSDTEAERKKATVTKDNTVDLLMEEAEWAKKSFTAVSKTTTDDDQYSTDVISDTPGLVTSRQSLTKKSILGARKRNNKDTKHIADQQVCNKEMANKDGVPNIYEYVEQNMQKTQNFIESLANKTMTKQAKLEKVRPQRAKKPIKAREAVANKLTSNIKQPSKGNKRVCTISESEQEDIVEALSHDTLNQSEVEKHYERDDTPAVDQNAKRKRKLYSPKDDDHSFKEPSKTNKDTNIQRDTPYKMILAQRQKAGNTNSNDDLLSPRTVQRNVIFDKLISEREVTSNEVVVDKNTKDDVYNYPSEDSYDEDFEERMTRLNSTSKTKQMARKKGGKKTTAPRRKKKTIEKQVKKRASRRNSEIIEHAALDDLDDERMRATNNDNALDISFVSTRPNKEKAPLSFSTQINCQIIRDDDVKVKKTTKQQDKPNLINTRRRTTRAMSTTFRQPSPVPSDKSGNSLPGLNIVQDDITSISNDFSFTEEISKICNKNHSARCEPLVNDHELNDQVMHEQIDVQPNKRKPENGKNKQGEKKQKISESKSKPATKSSTGLSKDAKSKRRVEEVEDPKETEDELDMEIEYSHVEGHDNFDEPPPNKKIEKKNQAQKASTTDAKSKVRIAEVEEPQEIDDEIDVANEDDDVAAHGNINEPPHKIGMSKPTEERYINMKDRKDKTLENMEAGGSCDTENESDKSTGGNDPAGDVEMASDEGIVNQSNRSPNICKEVPKEVRRRNSATQTSPEKSARLSAVENTTQKSTLNTSKNRTLDKTPAKDKNTEPRASTSKHIEINTNEDTEISSTSRKRKASPERRGGKAPRMLYGELRTSQDDRVSCARRRVQTDEDNVTAEVLRYCHCVHNDNPWHQLPTTSTDARPGISDILLQKLERRSKWILTSITRNLTELKSEYVADSGEMMELLRHWKDDRVSCICNKSHTRKENSATGVEKQNDNPRHQLQESGTEPRQGAKLDILIRQQKRMDELVKWQISTMEQSLKVLTKEMSENFADIKQAMHP